jgi:universal stress protein A
MQYKRILVPVDFSEGNDRAISVASDLAAASGGEVTLLHVIETLADTPFEELADFYGRLEEKARRGMEELAASTDAEPTHSEIRYGKRARAIVDYAREQMTELIVLSSHSVEREEAFRAWATLSYSVALLAPCSVMLVK